LKLLPSGHPLRSRVLKNLQTTDRLLKLDRQLLAILEGERPPEDARDQLALADLCLRYKQRHVTAARFFAAAFTTEPTRADDLRLPHRYTAACSAALAGAGQGNDAANLPEQERVHWPRDRPRRRPARPPARTGTPVLATAVGRRGRPAPTVP